MTRLRITSDSVQISFVRWEKTLGLVGDITLPLASISEVEVVPDGYFGTRGMRAPGLGFPRRRKLGTWRSRSGRQLVSVSRGKPAVRIRLAEPVRSYDEVLIGADDAAAIAAGLDRARR